MAAPSFFEPPLCPGLRPRWPEEPCSGGGRRQRRRERRRQRRLEGAARAVANPLHRGQRVQTGQPANRAGGPIARTHRVPALHASLCASRCVTRRFTVLCERRPGVPGARLWAPPLPLLLGQACTPLRHAHRKQASLDQVAWRSALPCCVSTSIRDNKGNRTTQVSASACPSARLRQPLPGPAAVPVSAAGACGARRGVLWECRREAAGQEVVMPVAAACGLAQVLRADCCTCFPCLGTLQAVAVGSWLTA